MKKLLFKQKIVSSLLALSLILPVVSSIVSAEVPQNEVSQSTEICKNLYGFSLKKDLLINEHHILEYQHEKSGAWLVVEKNNNIDKKFEISVRTPAENDKGTNHVIEHCVLNGSKEFPCKSMIWELTQIANATFINAFTTPCYTSFPVSSVDEDELESLAKVYSSGVFHPMFREEKKIFNKEGVRLELGENDKLIPNGTVFNEMQKGAQGQILNHLIKHIFPDTKDKNFFGGIPEEILNLTYEEICETYKKHYHPANMVIYMGGNINYERFMKWLDEEYLHEYDKKDFKGVSYLSQNPNNVPKYSCMQYYNPKTDENLSTAAISHILDWETYTKNKENLELISSILNNSSLPQNKFLQEKGYHVTSLLYDIFYNPLFSISFQSTDKDSLTPEKISNVLKETFEKHPITQSIIDTCKNKTDLNKDISKKTRMYDENLNSQFFINSFIRFDDPCSEKYFTDKTEESVQNTLNNVVLNKEFITTVFNPSDDLSLSPSAKLKEKIDSLEAQKDVLTQNYKEQRQWAKAPNDEKNLQKLKKMFKKLSDINIPSFKCPLDISKFNEKNYYYSKQDIDDLVSYKFVFKLDKVSESEKKYLELLTNAINSHDTKNFSREQFKNEESNCCNTSVYTTIHENNGKEEIFMVLNTICKKENLEKTFSLINEQINNLKFNDIKNLSNFVKLKQIFYNSVDKVNLKYLDLMLRIVSNNVSHEELKTFYSDISSKLNDDNFIKNLSANLENVKNQIFNRDSLVGIGVSASEKNKEIALNSAQNFVNSINICNKNTEEKIKFTELPQKNIAFISPNQTNNNLTCVIQSEELAKDPTFNVTCKFLTSNFLNPLVREKGGAYGSSINSIPGSNKIVISSYFDPNFKSTLEIFKKIPEFIENHKFSEKEIENISKSMLGSLMIKNKLKLSENQLENIICEQNNYCESLNESIEKIKKMTPEQIKLHGKILEKIINNMKVYLFTGNLKDSDKEIFDEIIK